MSVWFLMTLTFSIFILPVDALAYIGPGAGLSAIGSLVALVAAVFLAIVGFIWYPVKRMLRWRRTRRELKEKEKEKAGQ